MMLQNNPHPAVMTDFEGILAGSTPFPAAMTVAGKTFRAFNLVDPSQNYAHYYTPEFTAFPITLGFFRGNNGVIVDWSATQSSQKIPPVELDGFVSTLMGGGTASPAAA